MIKSIKYRKIFLLLSCFFWNCLLRASDEWNNYLQRRGRAMARSGGMSPNTTPEPDVFNAPIEDLYWLPCLLALCYVFYKYYRLRRKTNT